MSTSQDEQTQTEQSAKYGTNDGARRIDPIAAYMRCEYEWDEPNNAHQSASLLGPSNTHYQCHNVAVITPGYRRACHIHVLHVLRDSLASYLTRERMPASALPEALVTLRTQQDSALHDTLTTLQIAINPPPRPTRKRTTAPPQ